MINVRLTSELHPEASDEPGHNLMHADLIVTEGQVLTMDLAAPKAEALAIANGKIMAVGSASAINALRGKGTAVISAQGNTVLPGFIESHMHLFGGAAELHHLPMEDLHGFAQVSHAVRHYVTSRPPAKVHFGRGAKYNMLGSDGPLTRHHLDRMCQDVPFAVASNDHHTMWANTKALEATGLLRGKKLGPGNEIVMGADGLATGELREVEAFGPITKYAGEHRATLGLATGGEPDPPATAEEKAADRLMIKRGLAWCARHGITSIHNMDGNLYTLELLSEIQDQGELICRNKVPFHFKNFMKPEALAKASLMAERYQTDWLTSGLVKMFMDGVLESCTAYTLDGYADSDAGRGDPLFTQEQFNEIVIEADRRGLQIAVHSVGDAAVRGVLDGFEAAQQVNGKRDSRHRVEHIEIISEADIPRLKQLGVIASMQPPHAAFITDTPVDPTIARIGEKRWGLAYPWRTLKNTGAHVVFASDWPVSSIDVLSGVQRAVTRKPWAAGLPEQSFTVTEALRAYTVEGAYAEFAEHKKGVLKPGYFGDVVVLSGNIEKTAPDEIDQLHPVTTICGGRVTYQA